MEAVDAKNTQLFDIVEIMEMCCQAFWGFVLFFRIRDKIAYYIVLGMID